MRNFVLLSTLIVLAACAQATQSVDEAVRLSKDNWYEWQKKYWELYNYEPFDPPAQLAQIRYCYGTDSDVVCYARPQPGLTNLIGYQGPPPDELMRVIQEAETEMVADAFENGEISVVELEDPTAVAVPEEMITDGQQAEATGAPQGLLSSF